MRRAPLAITQEGDDLLDEATSPRGGEETGSLAGDGI
jgi:hypothetical protein